MNGQQLIVLADDTGHRAVPLWLPGLDFKLLWWLLDRPARDAVMPGVLEETAARLLHAAGVAVTAVDIEPAGGDVPELRSDTAAARSSWPRPPEPGICRVPPSSACAPLGGRLVARAALAPDVPGP